jgi:pre-mRNA-splicing factor CDC5/CEF1
MGLGDLPAPKNEYQIMVPDLPEEEPVEGDDMEADMSDVLARQHAEEAAKQAALLRKRSKVLQRVLPRPPPAAIEMMRASLAYGEDGKAAPAPVTLIDHADLLVRAELVALLEYDAAKYPMLEEESSKAKKKGAGKNAANGNPQVPVPVLEDFDEADLNDAGLLIEEELGYIRSAMGHEDATLDDYAEARDACVDDLMYLPTRDSFGLASVASTSDRLAALQYQFENVKKQMEAETRKAVRLEQKIKVLTQGYQVRTSGSMMGYDLPIIACGIQGLGNSLIVSRGLYMLLLQVRI